MARNHSGLGPYSKRFARGSLAGLDGRSSMGRLARVLEAQLVAHCGGSVSITQRMLIDRLIKVRIQLDLLDEKLTRGDWTPHDQRTYGGLLNAYRLTAREIGIKAAPAAEPTLADVIADVRRRKAEAAA